MTSSRITLLVVLASAGCAFGVGVSDVIGLLKLGHVVIHESLEMMLPRLTVEKLLGENEFMEMMERKLLDEIGQISRQIDEYQEQMETKTDMILTQMLVRLPMQRRLDENMRDLDRYIGQVQGLYKFFEMYANNPDRYEKFTILQFAKTCVSPRLGELPDILKSIHRLLVPSEQQVYNRSILVLLANQLAVGT